MQISIALEHILVQRRFLEDAARLEELRARVDEIETVERVAQLDGAHFADRLDRPVERRAGGPGDRFEVEPLAFHSKIRAGFAELADHLLRMQRRELPDGWDVDVPAFEADEKGMGGRDASGRVLNAIAARVPWLVGGAADLAPSTKTRLTFDGAGDLSRENPGGRNIHFGVREHAMHAVLNGLSLSKLRPFGSQFLIFSDYARAQIRLSALMELPVIHIFTHDSIGVGEDGPTHQPIGHLASLRSMPGLITLRPGDANEVAEAWRLIMELHHDPVALVLSRQPIPTLDRSRYASAEGVRRGAYVLADPEDGSAPGVILIATGSEVALAAAAYEQLASEGLAARVQAQPGMEVCGEAADVDDGLRRFAETRPDLMIVDLALKHGNGLDLIERVRSSGVGTKILVVSAYEEALFADRALRAGAHGYVNKQEAQESILRAIRAVMSGERYVSPEMTRRLADEALGATAKRRGIANLTSRELEVLELIGQGRTRRAIAEKLALSVHTIETHRQNIRKKLGLRTGAELGRRAAEWVLQRR